MLLEGLRRNKQLGTDQRPAATREPRVSVRKAKLTLARSGNRSPSCFTISRLIRGPTGNSTKPLDDANVRRWTGTENRLRFLVPTLLLGDLCF